MTEEAPKTQDENTRPRKTATRTSTKKTKKTTTAKTAKKATRKKLRSRLTPEQIEELFARLAAERPNPQSELEFHNPFTLLVAVVLSAQATDVGVNKATRALFQVADTPEKMVALGEEKLREYIRTIGLYRNKAKNIIALSRILVEKYGGEVPDDREALESLPGVGRKSANVVLNVAFGQPVMAVDTHIFRLCNRTGLAPGKTPREVEDLLMEIVPDKYRLHAHHWLILHGRHVCKSRKPLCPRCVISDICLYEDKTLPMATEGKKKKT